MAALLGGLDGREDKVWSRNKNRFSNTEIDSHGDYGSTRDAPFNIDGVVVGGVSIQDRIVRSPPRQHMHVSGRCRGGVAQIFRVDVGERRLEETPEKGDNAKNGARSPHDSLS